VQLFYLVYQWEIPPVAIGMQKVRQWSLFKKFKNTKVHSFDHHQAREDQYIQFHRQDVQVKMLTGQNAEKSKMGQKVDRQSFEW
jgi:hypothetical protein